MAVVQLSRVAKRDDTTVLGLEAFFTDVPEGVQAVVLDVAGMHFSAGLDLAELTTKDAQGAMQHSRMWHRVFARIEHGTVPVMGVSKGATSAVAWNWRPAPT